MIESISESPLYRIANPQSIAFFGASKNISGMGTSILGSLQAQGFEGPVYPVHPRDEQILGLTACKDVRDLPEIPDLAVMVLPTRVVPEVLDACGEKGIRQAVIVSGGFQEVGPEGADLQKSLLAVAQNHGIRLLGPNCLGVANPHHKLNTTFLPNNSAPGFIGMASQSGSFITQMFSYLDHYGMGFSTGFSVGNEANIDLVDCLEYLGACPHTRVIALYVETLRRGRQFIETARAIVPHKPIVAYYVGGSAAGKTASLSHTGALAGPDRLYDGVFRQSGVIRAHSMEELFDFCLVLGTCPPPKGNRMVIQTHSGGPGAVAADACSRNGLEINPLGKATLEALAPYVPSTGSANNPVDLTFSRNPMDFFSSIPKILIEEPSADGLLVYFLIPDSVMRRALDQMGVPTEQIEGEVRKIIHAQCQSIYDLQQQSPKPIVGFSFMDRNDRFISRMVEMGFPILESPTRAARAMAALYQYTQFQRKLVKSA
ncbi:MAG: CoA-binding protein [Desulfobacterales bacterium]|nr:CoA-binding protein [Desulfobacterales bacterium]